MKIGIIQLTSILNPEINLQKIESFLIDAKKKQVEAMFLPECFYSMSDGKEVTPYIVEKKNEHYLAIKNLAFKYNIFILGGSAATKVGDKIFNRSYNFSPAGEDLGHYDKVNLFSCELPGNSVSLCESNLYSSGKEQTVIQAGSLLIGLAICFDLRFPNFFQEYSQKGINVISVSSAFTKLTGKAHWEILLRARAIENQCFIVAAAQYGKSNNKIETFGHSMIVDPWGQVLVNAGIGEKVVTADLNLDKISEVKKAIKLN